MPSEPPARSAPVDVGLLSPVTAGLDEIVSDAAVLRALVEAEAALVVAWARTEAPDAPALDEASAVAEALRRAGDGLDAAAIAEAAVSGGNPVIPLVAALRSAVPAEQRVLVHRGATSQDVLDTALALVAASATRRIRDALASAAATLGDLAVEHRDTPAAARTLTQHAVPTTVGLRVAGWAAGLRRAAERLDAAVLPVQLGGAAGTLAAAVELGGAPAARRLVDEYARELGLAAPAAPWHTARWPITELGDALVRSIDAAGKLGTDVATLSRTEIGELVVADGGGSSAMPQKRNPVGAVLLRSAALRAPQLGATLHLAAALAADERPDGAWHAEWPTLRELLRLALGASAHAASLARGLRVDTDAVVRNLAATGGAILSEQLSIVLAPLLGTERTRGVLAQIAEGADPRDVLGALPEAASLDLDDLLDPSRYLGLAGEIVDRLLGRGDDGGGGAVAPGGSA